MAHKRMFSRDITDSDSFTGMSPAAQALYLHLNQGADDDGMNNQVRIAMQKAHASSRELRLLQQKDLVIVFDSGVVAIRHWWINNTLRKDRYTPTKQTSEMNLLTRDNGGVYIRKENQERISGCHPVATGLPSGCPSKEEKRKGKKRIEKQSIVDAGRSPEAGPGGTPGPPEYYRMHLPFQSPTLEQVRQYCQQRGNSVDPQRWFDFYTANGWMMGRTPMRDWQAALRTWENNKHSTMGGFLDIMEELDE